MRLKDDSECVSAVTDAAPALGDKRVTFTCAPGNFALVGSFERLDDMLLAERVTLSETGGPEPYGTVILPVTSLTLDAESSTRQQ